MTIIKNNGFLKKVLDIRSQESNLSEHIIASIQKKGNNDKKYVSVSPFRHISEHIGNIPSHYDLTVSFVRSRNFHIFYLMQRK